MPEDADERTDYNPDTRFLRRIHTTWIVADYKVGEWRTSSQAYQPHRDSHKMSVTCVDDYSTEEAAAATLLESHDGYGVVAVTYAELIDLGLTVTASPLPDNPGHCFVEGTKTKQKQRALSRIARWVHNPRTDVPLPPLAEDRDE